MTEGVKCMCGMCMQKPCNVCNVYNNNQAGWVIGQFYSPCCNVSLVFRLFSWLEISGCLRVTQGYSTKCALRAELYFIVTWLPMAI